MDLILSAIDFFSESWKIMAAFAVAAALAAYSFMGADPAQRAIFRTLAVVALVVAVYFQGEATGRADAEVRCDKKIQDMRDAAQVEKDRLQAKADDLAKAYQDSSTAAAGRLATVRKELQNAKAKNAAYSECRAGGDFLRLYRGLVAGE